MQQHGWTWRFHPFILSEVSKTEWQIPWYHSYMESNHFLKDDTYVFIKQTYKYWKQTYGCHGGNMGQGINQGLAIHLQKHSSWYIYITDNQQGSIIEHRQLYEYVCDNLYEKRIWKRMNTCICIAESLYRATETNTTLYINCVCVCSQLYPNSLWPHGL